MNQIPNFAGNALQIFEKPVWCFITLFSFTKPVHIIFL